MIFEWELVRLTPIQSVGLSQESECVPESCPPRLQWLTLFQEPLPSVVGSQRPCQNHKHWQKHDHEWCKDKKRSTTSSIKRHFVLPFENWGCFLLLKTYHQQVNWYSNYEPHNFPQQNKQMPKQSHQFNQKIYDFQGCANGYTNQ